MKIYTIIPGKLYQSAYTHQLCLAALSELIDSLQLNMIVNLWSQPDLRISESGFPYLHCQLPDGLVNSSMLRRAEQAADQITAELEVGRRVLVHCRGGRNRASFVSALALMRYANLTGAEAALRVAEARPNAFSNRHFYRYLERL